MIKILSSIVGILIVLQIPTLHSFEVPTHRALSDLATRSSNLDDFLKSQLLLPGGINESVAGRRVFEWVQEGSDREDDGFRFFNHFHNPLRAWSQAGLRPLGVQLGSSSILWGQNASQEFGWQNARSVYFEALTSQTKQVRDEKFAAIAETLGQLIHLPQDAAVPAHTRNDQHLAYDGFERFALSVTGTPLFDQLTQNPVRFDPSILNFTQNPLAPVPIARIIDATDPEQAQATPSAGTNQGMAEYSNANFLSGDTIFKDFAFPRLESIDLNSPLTLNNRRYFTKITDGETNYFLVAEGTFTERLLSLVSGDKGFVLDSQVYQDYASLLLPRAVGYSAGLLDYFFRGRMELLQDADTPAGPTEVRLKVRNSTPNENAGVGEIVGLIEFFSGDRRASASQMINLTSDFQEIIFDFGSSLLNDFDLSRFPKFLSVVYKGHLGMEDQAVIAKTIKPRLASLCDGRRGFTGCLEGWQVPSLAATLIIEARGLNNTGELRACAANEDAECLDDQIFPVSFTTPSSVSITAPTSTESTAVRSFFFLDTIADSGGFVCVFNVTSPSPGVEGLDVGVGFRSWFCPQ